MGNSATKLGSEKQDEKAVCLRRTRHTRQRQAVLETVASLAGQHPTAADVHARLHADYPNLSLATVYRALHALTEQRIITEMRVENVARYDAGPEPHHHLVCRHCGNVTDIALNALPPAALQTLTEALRAAGLTPDPFPIQFFGVCANCQ